MVCCYLHTVKIPISIWGNFQKLHKHPNPGRKRLWCYLKVLVGYWKVIWCYLVLFSVTKKFFNFKTSYAKITGLLYKLAYKRWLHFLFFEKLNKCLFLFRVPVKKLEYLITIRGTYSKFFSRAYNWNKKEKHLLCQTTQRKMSYHGLHTRIFIFFLEFQLIICFKLVIVENICEIYKTKILEKNHFWSIIKENGSDPIFQSIGKSRY